MNDTMPSLGFNVSQIVKVGSSQWIFVPPLNLTLSVDVDVMERKNVTLTAGFLLEASILSPVTVTQMYSPCNSYSHQEVN